MENSPKIKHVDFITDHPPIDRLFHKITVSLIFVCNLCQGRIQGGWGLRRPDPPPSNFPKVPFSQEDFNDDPSSVNISEVFVDYVHLERTTVKAIADAIVKSLHDMGFDIENIRGQGYDGASAMSSSIQGVNGRIREIAPPGLIFPLQEPCSQFEYCIKLQADEYKEYDQFSERGIPILRQFPQETDVLGENLRQDRKCIQ